MSTWNGKALGNVLIGDLIARGGMAEVYYGTHSTLKRKVAIKIMRDHVEEDPDSRSRFDREARVVASLNHPNIIQVFDYTLVDGRPCIVMELVPGTSLGNYLKALQKRGETLTHETIAKLMKSIASAVDYAHERNIVHRDIKPANILLRSLNEEIDLEAPLPEDIEPVLTDFGLVRLLDSSTQTSTGTVSGTPSYMSPEQARGDKVDRKTDIYSLGVVLYEMLAGSVPFDAESSFGVLMKHLNEPPPPIPGISADMQAIINRALAKDPAHRFNSAGDMVNEFIAVLSGKKVSAETEKVKGLLEKAAVPALPPNATPSRMPIFIGGVLLLIVSIFAGVLLLRPNPQQMQPQQLQQPDPNQPVGRVIYDDFSYAMDEAALSLSGLPLPQPGTHFEVWLLSQGGEKRHSIGIVNFDGNNGELSYINPEGSNLIEVFDQIEITVEPQDGDPEPSGQVVASSIFPPLALVHVRHILVSIGTTPDGSALIQGLWGAVDSVDTSVIELREAFSAEDEETLRLRTEEIINQLAGNENAELYKDWNGDGEIDDPYDGFGILPNGEERGYISQTISHALFAMESPDASRAIGDNGERLVACARNIEIWSNELLELALQLQNMPYGPGMEATITEMEILSTRMLKGEDANQNGRIEPIPAEGGADTAYEHAYRMADMPLFTGANRVPPPWKMAP